MNRYNATEERISELWEFAESKHGDSAQVFVKYLKHIIDDGIIDSYDLLQKVMSNEAMSIESTCSFLRSPLAILMLLAFEWEAKKND